MELDIVKVLAACAVFSAAASEAAGADTAQIADGVTEALPGGSSTAAAASAAAVVATDALATLSRRSQRLRDSGAAAAETLHATDLTFSRALDAAVPG